MSPPPSVLVVDDTPANLGVLVGVLHAGGLRALVAESGESALAQLDHARPDLILLDIVMPGGIDGREVCRRIQAEPRWRDIPVLFVTSLADPSEKVRGLEAGAVDFITKPLHGAEVLARVRTHLRLRALQRDLEDKKAQLERSVALHAEAERQLQESLGQAVLVVHGTGEIQFGSRLARELLARHFPAAPLDRLPPPMAAWAAAAGAESWRTTTGAATLEARLFRQPGDAREDELFLLMLIEAPAAGPEAAAQLARELGISPREAEVLYWIAHGKTNPEVAIILGSASNTVRKQVQSIFGKLGVETRLAAALRAVEVLGTEGEG